MILLFFYEGFLNIHIPGGGLLNYSNNVRFPYPLSQQSPSLPCYATAGWNVCQDTSHGNGVSFEIQQQICNVAIAQDQRLSPHCTYGFLPIPRCCKHSVKNGMRPFFFKTVFATTQLTQLQIPLFFGSPTCDVNTAVTFSTSKKQPGQKTKVGAEVFL